MQHSAELEFHCRVSPAGRESRLTEIIAAQSVVDAYRLKCNRESPCQNCTARAQHDACTYRGHTDATKSVGRQRKGDDVAVRKRVDQLERLVRQLLSDRGSASASDNGKDASQNMESQYHEPSPSAPAATGKTIIEGSRSAYHGGNDWHVVLQEVRSLPFTWCHMSF